MSNKKESAPYLKKEPKNENVSEPKVEENKEEQPVYRDPWNDLLFGRRPEPPTPVNTEEAK